MSGVVGKGGPVPKRDNQVRRRNKGRVTAENAPSRVEVAQPDAPDGLHPRALGWYESLATSGQAVFYADSDWQVALICAEAITLFMETGRATLLAEIRALQSQLLATEGERRRVRLELGREAEEDDGDVSILDDARRRLRGAG